MAKEDNVIFSTLIVMLGNLESKYLIGGKGHRYNIKNKLGLEIKIRDS